jgi:hypothetical protein
MNAQELLRELRYVQKKHENDKLDTFQTSISSMARDCIAVVEELSAENAALTAAKAELEQKVADAKAVLKQFEEDCEKCETDIFIENRTLEKQLAAEKREKEAAVSALNEFCKGCEWEHGGMICSNCGYEKCRIINKWRGVPAVPDGAEGEGAK